MLFRGPIKQSALRARTASGRDALATADREKILTDLATGADRRVVIETIVFQQQADSRNRNFVRFKPGILKRFAASFVGLPFLRDHAQCELEARGGTILTSEWVGDKDGGELRQEIELAAPWAVDAALRGLMDRFSIGWVNTDAVVCSICDEPYHRSWFGAYPSCNHMPGDVTEDEDVVEMIVMGAEGIETSAVNTPAVEGTGVEAIRTQLAMSRRLHEAGRDGIVINVAGGTLADKEAAVSRVREAIEAARPKKENTMKSIAMKLGLTESSSEQEILGAIDRLMSERLERERIASLHSAEVAAHAVTKSERDSLQSELSTRQKAEHDIVVDQLIADVRAKVGPKIGDDGKPVRGGTDQEAYMLSAAARSLDEARAYVKSIPQVIKLGLSSPAPRLEVRATGGALSAEEKARARKLGISEESYAAAKIDHANRHRAPRDDDDDDRNERKGA